MSNNFNVSNSQEKRERTLNAIQNVIKDYDLLDCDFYETQDGNFCLTYAGCERINAKLSKDMQFDPEKVEYVFAPDGGCAFIYRGKVFVTGSASSLNSMLPFPVEQAARRVFCRYITKITGLSADGIHSEVESEAFQINPQNDPVYIPRQDYEPQAAPAAPKQKAHDAAPANAPAAAPSRKAINPKEKKHRIAKLAEGIAKTGTDLDSLLGYYHVGELSDLSDNSLVHAEGIISARLKEQNLAKAKQQIADSAPEAMDTPDGISPIAAMLLNNASPDSDVSPSAAEPTESPSVNEPATPVGQVVYACTPEAPEHFQELNGKKLDEIGKPLLKALYGRKNSVGRKYVAPSLLELIERYLAA